MKSLNAKESENILPPCSYPLRSVRLIPLSPKCSIVNKYTRSSWSCHSKDRPLARKLKDLPFQTLKQIFLLPSPKIYLHSSNILQKLLPNNVSLSLVARVSQYPRSLHLTSNLMGYF